MTKDHMEILESIDRAYRNGYSDGYDNGRTDTINGMEETMIRRYNALNSRGKHYVYEFMRSCLMQLKEKN